MLVGIKVDTGAKSFAAHPGEKVTRGLDGLRERLQSHCEMGARFAKWRDMIAVDDMRLPTGSCIDANAHALARYAALCQEAGLVPIIEPGCRRSDRTGPGRSDDLLLNKPAFAGRTKSRSSTLGVADFYQSAARDAAAQGGR